MKKILAGIIAITTVFCTFTGCGSANDEKTNGNETSVETTAANEEETSEDKEEETKEDIEEDKTDDKVYEDIINKYIDAVNSKDIEKVYELQMPDGCMDVAKFKMMQEYANLLEDVESDKKVDELMKRITDVMPTLKLNKIVCVEELNDNEMDSLKNTLSVYIKIADYINKQGGIKNVDIDKFVYGDLDQSDNSDSIKIDDAKYVVFETLEEGKDESTEEFYIYRINGGEWHIDNFMVLNVKPLKTASENSTARSLKNAANPALIEMDEEGKLPKLKGALVCSDDSKNINVPDDFDTSVFKKKLNNYFNDEEKFDWFVVINEKSTVYAVAVEKEKSQIGTYPGNSILKSDMDTQNDDRIGSKSFDEVYDMCAEVLK